MHNRQGLERVGMKGTGDRELSSMDCGDRTVSHNAEVAQIR
jgi:hypothetical protein